jgi:DNA invertase Pin-like site-specific DNA recombinase
MTTTTVTALARRSRSAADIDPSTQFASCEEWCSRPERGWVIAEKHIEKLSGSKSIDKRPALLAAEEDVRAGRASIVLVYHRDRLDRNLDVRREFVRRIEALGGEVWSVSHGRLTFSTSREKLSNTIEGAMDENYRDVIAEKVIEQKTRRVEDGLVVGPIPRLGYRNPGGRQRLQVIEEHRVVVRRVFEMRADGQTRRAIRDYLVSQGHEASYSQIGSMLRSEVYLGHVVWGKLRHDNAHEALVSERLYRRVREAIVPKGRRSPSERLLARLGVLHCACCGRRMVVSAGASQPVQTYKCCGRPGECSERVSIAADAVERIVLERVAREIKTLEGHAGDVLTPALAEQERANAQLEKLRRIAVLSDDVEGFADQIRDAKARVARANAAVEDARSVSGVTWSLRASPDGPDFDGLGRESLRDLISTVLVTARVSRRQPGESIADRVEFKVRPSFDAARILDAAAEGLAPVIGREYDEEATIAEAVA